MGEVYAGRIELGWSDRSAFACTKLWTIEGPNFPPEITVI